MRNYKKGDIVRVWSLQSFHHGGFIDGRIGIVRQDQGKGSSVIVALMRNFGGERMVDFAYEVYARQCELVATATKETIENITTMLRLADILREENDHHSNRNKAFYLDEDEKRIKVELDLIQNPEKILKFL